MIGSFETQLLLLISRIEDLNTSSGFIFPTE